MSKIFLSHTNKDKPFVRKLASDLRRFGHIVWIDEAEINVGDSLIGKIREGLDSVDYVAVVLSKASIDSEWVRREIEIASNREIEEKKVIVLPLLIENVELPGFLKGKFYGDFSDESQYSEKLEILLRTFGDSKPIIQENSEDLIKLKEELEQAKLIAEKHKKVAEQLRTYNLLTKSENLRKRIIEENEEEPKYAPINNVYAFEIGKSDTPITLGYLLHVIGKIRMKGSHQIEFLLEHENKWDLASRMLKAYFEMIESEQNK